MAGVLVRLKLTLLRAGIASAGIQGRVSAVLAVVLAVVGGGIGGLLFSGVRLVGDEAAAALTSAGFAFLLLAWVLGPIVTAGAEGTLDPARLSLLPLSRRQLMPGLLLAALVGFGGLLTVIVLLGAVAGMTPGTPLAPVVPLAAASHLLLCAGLSRLVATVVSGATTSRRWRDVALFAAPAVALVLNVGLQFVNVGLSRRGPSALSAFVPVARLLGGPAALAASAARSGDTVGALAWSLVAAGAVVLTLVAWGAALDRTLTAGGSSGVRAGRAPRPLRPRWLPLPAGRTGAVAAKELRLTWRDPRQRAAFLGVLVGSLLPLFSLRLLVAGSPRGALVAAVPLFILGTQSTNQFGYDGRAHWTNVASGEEVRGDLLGKNVARAVLSAPVGLVVLAVFVSRADTLTFVVPAVGLALFGFGVAMGMGNWSSVVAPVGLPDSTTNVFSSGNAGQGLAAAGPAFAVLLGGAIVVLPLLIPLLVVDDPVVLQILGLAGVLAGFGAWRIGLGAAVRRAAPRQPELLAALEPSS